MQEKKLAKDTTLVPIICDSLLLIALTVLLWSLRLLLSVMLLNYISCWDAGCLCLHTQVGAQQTSEFSKSGPSRGQG